MFQIFLKFWNEILDFHTRSCKFLHGWVGWLIGIFFLKLWWTGGNVLFVFLLLWMKKPIVFLVEIWRVISKPVKFFPQDGILNFQIYTVVLCQFDVKTCPFISYWVPHNFSLIISYFQRNKIICYTAYINQVWLF